MKLLACLFIAALMTVSTAAAETRAASDFEIAAMRRQLESASDAFSRLSAHLNLGDLFLERGETTTARAHYTKALVLAEAERTRSRETSALRRYARATSYAGLAAARLGRDGEAFRLLEESLRYDSDSAGTWNVYASAMTVLGKHSRSVSAARNAVTIASRRSGETTADSLELSIYRYALASALSRYGTSQSELEAEDLLLQVTLDLAGTRFDGLRRQIARNEQFEIFSSTRSDSAAYLSLLNRSRLRLATIYEESGRITEAETQYRSVLRDRVDDPTALAGMARLGSGEERRRYFEESFDASPFSLPVVRQYEAFLDEHPDEVSMRRSRGKAVDRNPRLRPGRVVQRAVEEAAVERHQEAVALLEPLAALHPENSTLRYLIVRSKIRAGRFEHARETLQQSGMPGRLADELRALLADEQAAASAIPSFLDGEIPAGPVELSHEELVLLLRKLRTGSLAPEQMTMLDALHFTAPVSFERATSSDSETTTFQSGSMHRQPFRFAAPVAFRGRYDASAELQLEFQILGVTESDGRETILLQPWKVRS